MVSGEVRNCQPLKNATLIRFKPILLLLTFVETCGSQISEKAKNGSSWCFLFLWIVLNVVAMLAPRYGRQRENGRAWTSQETNNTPVWDVGDWDDRLGVCYSSLTEIVGRKSRSSNPLQLPLDGGQNDSVGGWFSRMMGRRRSKRSEHANMKVSTPPPSTLHRIRFSRRHQFPVWSHLLPRMSNASSQQYLQSCSPVLAATMYIQYIMWDNFFLKKTKWLHTISKH